MDDYYISENAQNNINAVPANQNDFNTQNDTGVQQAQPVPLNLNRQSLPPTLPPTVPPPNSQNYKYNSHKFTLNFKEILKRAVKYLLEGLAVAFIAYYFIVKGKLDIKEIVALGITAAFVFAILDTFSPTIALGARFGAGFGIGQGLFGLAPGSFLAAPMAAAVV